MKEYLMKTILALSLVLIVTSCAQRKTVVVESSACIEVSEQKKIDTQVSIPVQKNIPFKRIGNVTIVGESISDDNAIYLNSNIDKKIVVSTGESFSDMLRSIAEHRSASSALVVIREFYENQIDRNNDRLKDLNVSK